MRSRTLLRRVALAILLLSMTSLTSASCQPQPDKDIVYRFRFKAESAPGKQDGACGFWDTKDGKTIHYVSCEDAEKQIFYGIDERTLRDALEYRRECDSVLNP